MINTDHWTERWPDHPVIRTFDEPRAVKVTSAGRSHSDEGEHHAPIT